MMKRFSIIFSVRMVPRAYWKIMRRVKRVRKDVNPVSKHTEYFLNIRGGSFITRIYTYSGIDICNNTHVSRVNSAF
jgi:hypothetical protein